ncbi:unnamed protein product [Adineta steineri]|uniref:Uncharacterized protein n=1 Tax=Adineta steineri TaxID=433720 RepID=A0A815J6Z2_9BILA|nr:unnamed protein product [Adineta steineri]
MHTNQVYSELVTVNNGTRKWWHRRWVKIIGISVIVLIVVATILALVLNFVVFAPKKSETSTTAVTSSSPLTITISTPTSLLTTTPLVTSTTTLSQTTTTIPLVTPIITLPQITTTTATTATTTTIITATVTPTTTLPQTTTTTSQLVTSTTTLSQTTATTTTQQPVNHPDYLFPWCVREIPPNEQVLTQVLALTHQALPFLFTTKIDFHTVINSIWSLNHLVYCYLNGIYGTWTNFIAPDVTSLSMQYLLFESGCMDWDVLPKLLKNVMK